MVVLRWYLVILIHLLVLVFNQLLLIQIVSSHKMDSTFLWQIKDQINLSLSIPIILCVMKLLHKIFAYGMSVQFDRPLHIVSTHIHTSASVLWPTPLLLLLVNLIQHGPQCNMIYLVISNIVYRIGTITSSILSVKIKTSSVIPTNMTSLNRVMEIATTLFII